MRLWVEGTTAEDSTVTVGRNLGSNVYVGAKQSLQGQGTSISVEVDVYKGVTVDSEVTPEGSSSVGLSFSKDF